MEGAHTGSNGTRSEAPHNWEETLEVRRAKAPDGTGIAYEVLGLGERTIVLANGLGGRLYAWRPALEALYRDYRIITWDYRGLFGSDSPASQRQLAVAHHAEDARVILEAERVDRAVFIGWSMGVQVSLDFTASFPERVAGLVLLNGTHGHVLSTGFQPLFTVPFLPKRLHAVLDWLQDHREIAASLARVSRLMELPTFLMMCITAGPSRAREISPLLSRYMDDVLGESFPNFLRLFQELDAHSVYHLLRYVEAPALVISGKLDILTPSYQSREIARRIPRARHLSLTRSSHFSMLERPEIVVPALRRFLDEEARF